ncbi:hypothetical protein IJF81_04515 [bacterium]|nr:hypothetical protein [bacterium]
MYILNVETPTSFAPDKVGEYYDLEKAQNKAKELKEKNPEITYTIEESTGGFNSYGELLTEVIERG